MDGMPRGTHDFALAALRVVVGAVFIAHGCQKLFGWFHGPGITAQGKFFESAACVAKGVCLSPGAPLAALSGFGELVGGALLVLGLLMPLAAFMLLADQLVAMIFFSGPRVGYFNPSSGLEMNLTLVAAVLIVALIGTGRFAAGAAIKRGGGS